MNTVSVDRKFLEHCLSVMRGVGELCQPIPRKSEDDPTEYCGGQALAELANCYNRLQETIAYAEQVALPQAEQDHAGPLDGEGRRSTQGGRSMNTVSVSRKTLEEWALCLSQGDISPRWEIEALLTQPEQPAEQPEAGRDLAAHIAEAIERERFEIVIADLYRKALEEVIRDALKVFRPQAQEAGRGEAGHCLRRPL